MLNRKVILQGNCRSQVMPIIPITKRSILRLRSEISSLKLMKIHHTPITQRNIFRCFTKIQQMLPILTVSKSRLYLNTELWSLVRQLWSLGLSFQWQILTSCHSILPQIGMETPHSSFQSMTITQPTHLLLSSSRSMMHRLLSPKKCWKLLKTRRCWFFQLILTYRTIHIKMRKTTSGLISKLWTFQLKEH